VKKITKIGLDLAKTLFQVHGVDQYGRVVVRKQLRRNQVMQFFAQIEPCLVGMEACGSAHYWARKLSSLGHTVRLIPPQYVKPYVKTNKHDAADAEAICEAVDRPNMRFAAIKTAEQQAILSVHRVRQGYVTARTALSNQIRGLLAEYGVVLPKGIRHLTKVHQAMDDAQALPGSFKALIQMQIHQFREIEQRIAECDRQITVWHQGSEASQRLAAIPGIGLITATAAVATIGDAKQFRNGRHLGAWVGLVPRQMSSGGKTRLMGISKHGDVYLRTLLIHGARSVLLSAEKRPNADQIWHVKVMRRRNKNVAAVALAHKNARAIWALLAKDQIYDPGQRPAVAV
jgi:transposase